MCRLFGMTAGRQAVGATFWLLDAPDSLEAQSHRNVDGSGIGFFDPAGKPVLDKQPEPAFSDEEFIRAAKQATSTTFIAHVRWATAGGRTVANTHPFAMDGRIMAHNGGFGELARLDYQLGSDRKLVHGDTDSERYFALITQQTEARGGDVGAGITAAARWIGERLPVSSLNVIVAAPGELWALRYPGQHALHVIERPAGNSIPAASGAPAPPAGMHVRSATSSVHVPALRSTPTVVVASEELDGERGWRMLADGELIHVRADLTVESAVVIPEPPARLVPLPAHSPNIARPVSSAPRSTWSRSPAAGTPPPGCSSR
jgi:predicted glutamine amidotransferase